MVKNPPLREVAPHMLLCAETEGVGEVSTGENVTFSKKRFRQHPSASTGEQPVGSGLPSKGEFPYKALISNLRYLSWRGIRFLLHNVELSQRSNWDSVLSLYEIQEQSVG